MNWNDCSMALPSSFQPWPWRYIAIFLFWYAVTTIAVIALHALGVQGIALSIAFTLAQCLPAFVVETKFEQRNHRAIPWRLVLEIYGLFFLIQWAVACLIFSLSAFRDSPFTTSAVTSFFFSLVMQAVSVFASASPLMNTRNGRMPWQDERTTRALLK